MSTIAAAFAVPGAKSALHAAQGVADAAGQSFADALRTAAAFCHAEPAEIEPTESSAERDATADRIAAQLEELFSDAGILPGEEVRVTIADGAIDVDGGSPALAALRASILADSELTQDLQTLATLDGQLSDSDDDARLLVQIDGPSEATLAWQ